MVWNDQIESFIEEHITDDVRLLALGKNPLKGEELHTALLQIELRQRLLDKLPRFCSTKGIRFPSKIASEQCSSERCAAFKQVIIGGHYNKGVDLTGGMGIDTLSLASLCDRMLYIERNEELCEAARINFPLFADNVSVLCMDAEQWLSSTAENERVDIIFLDPARRDSSGGKVFRIEDCTPDVKRLLPLLRQRASKVVVKLSTMLDIHECIEALNPESITVVSLNNECKELIAVITDHEGETKIEAVELRANDSFRMSFTLSEEAQAEGRFAETISEGMILAEPFAGFMKSGAFRTMCNRYNASMIAPNSHLYISDNELFPGRCFRIREVSLFNKHDAARLLAGKANIAVRNFPISVAEVRKRFRTQDGGDRYIFLTTDTHARKLIICCEKLNYAH